ncbi:DUF7344 domain-containing protein [Halobellus salinisoli]|uniref:DUF7344 domain-containing protein n=1 Tax=Halobellus salinisoli TaxID=3108500 RepID=UPI003008435E
MITSLLDIAPGESVSLPEAAVNPNTATDRDSLRISLCHQHLPLMAEMGFIEWEKDPLTATHGPQFEEIGVLFEALFEYAEQLPTPLVNGCQRLEVERQPSSSD